MHAFPLTVTKEMARKDFPLEERKSWLLGSTDDLFPLRTNNGTSRNVTFEKEKRKRKEKNATRGYGGRQVAVFSIQQQLMFVIHLQCTTRNRNRAIDGPARKYRCALVPLFVVKIYVLRREWERRV